jgi:aminopeptidase C
MLPEDVKVQLPGGEKVTLKTVEDSSLTFYINNASFSFTQWDICANLNEILAVVNQGETPDSVVVSVSRKAKVIMNVAYAKQFADVLLRHVAKHEAIGKQAEAESTKAEPDTPSETVSQPNAD